MNNFYKKYNNFIKEKQKDLIGYNKTEIMKMFLKTLPTGKSFDKHQIEEVVRLHNLAVPVEDLIKYGNDCNWLTKKGTSFKSCVIFCNVYNSVYLQLRRFK